VRLGLSDAEINEMVRTGVALVCLHAVIGSGSADYDEMVPRAFLLADLFLDAVAKNDPTKKVPPTGSQP
jgi:hypothetical protein